jgi:hypothetical protein
MNEGSESRDIDMEWENRVLCSDEGCIGTIGPDGRCRECGRPYEGILPDRPEPGPPHEATGDDGGDGSGESPAASGDDNLVEDNSISVTDDEDDEWERRTLCPDESCIGVIGPDGRCKECGKRL